jgi:hypothetical protein
MPNGTQAVSRERDFHRWVGQRLADWPTSRILEFERWLVAESRLEFLPAVRDALWERSVEPAQGTVTG